MSCIAPLMLKWAGAHKSWKHFGNIFEGSLFGACQGARLVRIVTSARAARDAYPERIFARMGLNIASARASESWCWDASSLPRRIPGVQCT